MTVATVKNKHTYTGNGAVMRWTFSFLIFDETDIKVYLTEIATGAVTLLTNGYRVDMDNSEVIYPYPSGNPLPSTKKITLLREVPLIQETALPNQGPYFAKTIEKSLDRGVCISQQIQEQVSRSILHAVSVDPDVSNRLPAPVPLHSFRWAADGKSLEITLDPATVVEGATAEKEAAQAARAGAEAAQATTEALKDDMEGLKEYTITVRDETIAVKDSVEATIDTAVVAATVIATTAATMAQTAQTAAETAADAANMVAQSVADVNFASKTLMDADLAHAEGTKALVYADSSPETHNGVYIKSGASGAGSWGNRYVPPIVVKSVNPTSLSDDLYYQSYLYPFQPKVSYSKPQLRKAIKNITITGAVYGDKYSIEPIQRNVSGVWQVSVYRVSNTARLDASPVCRFYTTNYTEPNGDTTLTLDAFNNSGISGTVTIDWAQITNGTTIVDCYYAHGGIDERCVRYREIITPKDVGYPFQANATIERNSVYGRNLYWAIKDINIHGAAEGEKFYIQRYYYKFGSPAWSLITINRNDGARVCETYFRESEGYVYPADVTQVTLQPVSNSGITADIWLNWNELPEGSQWNIVHSATSWDVAGIDSRSIIINNIEDLEIIIPEKIFGVVGLETNIYYENIIRCNNIANYQIKVDATTGEMIDRKYRVVPTTAGTYTIRIKVYKDYHTLLASKTISLTVTAKNNIDATKNCIFIGDSLTDAGKYTQYLLDNCADDTFSVSLLGTRGASPNLHEGRAGWTAAQYVSTAAVGSVTNPFWDGSAFNFSYYMAHQGYPTPDFVGIALGTNDVKVISAVENVSAGVTAYITNITTIVSSIKSYNTGIKVGIIMPIPCSRDQYGFTYYYHNTTASRVTFTYGMYILHKALIAEFDGRETEGIYLVPAYPNFDADYNFPVAEIPIHARTTQTYAKQSDCFHPTDPGYHQIGDTVYCAAKSIWS